MKKSKGKAPKTKKYVSVMLVPHNSNRVKVWKTTRPCLKLFFVIAAFILAIITLSGYLSIVLKENQELREEYSALNSFFAEQQKIVTQKISTISEIEDIDKITDEKIEEFNVQVQSLVKNYIDREMKTVTISRSSVSTNSTVSFISKISELKALLNFLEEAGEKEDKLFAELTDKKEELEDYLNHLPTYWPTKGVIESEFGNRLHPIYRRYMKHTGVDIGVKKGNPVYAAASGTVIFAGKNGGYGYMVAIDHGNGLVTRYAHCSKILVKKWQKVNVGDKIAEVGDTGTATGPHLHFEILVNGEHVDPVIFIGTGGK